ncbi:c-type cytochrome [Maricaulis parjimensis]|uniref:c-type cytochrome n=1 Tax=Maricaulis parjimensis TaxID=144023 RepID=UPI00193A4BB5|nr:cytochrome c family protein [Maricaulis parjimensis]
MLRSLIPLASVLALGACGGETETSEPSASSASAAAQSATPAPAATQTASPAVTEAEGTEVLALAGADLGNGARQFRRCQSCHTLNEGGRHTIGPNLHGVLGNTAASQDGFAYSSQLSDAGLVWDLDTLNAWIENPRELVRGNRMSFVGLRNATDRRDVIAYILQETGDELAE